MPKSLKIEIASTIVLVGFFAAVVFHYVMNFYVDAQYPLNTFLFNPYYHQLFSDFFSDYKASKYLSPYMPEHIAAYFPAAYFLFYPFAVLGEYSGAIIYCILFQLILVVFCLYYFSSNSRINVSNVWENAILNFKNIFILSFMTFPALFAFERGNLESMVFVFLALSLFFYDRKRYLFSAMLLSLPISMKIYPAVFLVLFFSDRRYKETLICTFCVIVVTLLSLLIFKGSISHQLHELNSQLNWFKIQYMGAHKGLPFDLSYYSLLETIHRIKHHIPWDKDILPSRVGLRNYAIIMMFLFLCISFYIVKYETIFWKKVTLLVASMLIFPYISFDYKLLHIYLPLFFFVNSRGANRSSEYIYLIIFSLLLIPKNYMLIYGEVSFAVFADIFLLTLLVILIIIEKFSIARSR